MSPTVRVRTSFTRRILAPRPALTTTASHPRLAVKHHAAASPERPAVFASAKLSAIRVRTLSRSIPVMHQVIALRRAAVAPNIIMARASGISETILVRALQASTTATRPAIAPNRAQPAFKDKTVVVYESR